ncbi:hypothetical protein Aab01nite_43660 [Paractinoplanes abujensis]|uniref:Uncharacterized protein n=1 Tax=Paractinoplanes abujensis TaxID=882441 RepID=A0A7W7CMX1_9ACTN|nr:hypothetical protein [Actinoplanes abujensis]MBB4690003.1 hypothetical protein [Actinoplanes abujensis]GID20776.1 hypothetical protein Aab01nite_43660 [Actinoplanes abujensis]
METDTTEPNRWSYQGSADLGGATVGDLAHKGALLMAAAADAAAFSAVVSLIMSDHQLWEVWLIVLGLTVIALALAHFAGRIARDDAAAHGRVRWHVVLVCGIPWLLLGLAAVWVRMRIAPNTGGLLNGSSGQVDNRMPNALLFLVLYVASGMVAGIGEFLTRNPLRNAYRNLMKTYQKAQRKLARTQPPFERAMFVREIHRASFEEDDEVLLNAKFDRLAYGEELKQYAQITIAAHLQDPSATDGMTEADWRRSRLHVVRDDPDKQQPGAAA